MNSVRPGEDCGAMREGMGGGEHSRMAMRKQGVGPVRERVVICIRRES